jgi:hypothetical protein
VGATPTVALDDGPPEANDHGEEGEKHGNLSKTNRRFAASVVPGRPQVNGQFARLHAAATAVSGVPLGDVRIDLRGSNRGRRPAWPLRG